MLSRSERVNLQRTAKTLGTPSQLAHRLRQLRQWNGLVWDRSENSVNGDEEGWTMEMEMDSHGGLEVTIRQTELKKKKNYPTTS